MKKTILLFSALSLFVALPACDDDPSGVADGGLTGDGISGSYRDYIANKFMLPLTSADATKYGYDIDKDGKVDNALGAVLMALAAAAPSLQLQADMDQNVQNGNVISLYRVFAKDFSNDTAARLQSWTGKEKLCCTQKPCSKTDADANCFSGSNEFEPDVTSPSNAVINGSITAGTFTFGPGSVEVQLPIGKYSARVKLLAGKVAGTVSKSGIAEGAMMGAISQTDLKTQVVPQVAKVLEGEMNDATTSATTKAAIAAAFDTNKDGKITADEVLGNAAVQAVTAGDVDADGDGKAEEISAGVGFTAVGCTVKTN